MTLYRFKGVDLYIVILQICNRSLLPSHLAIHASAQIIQVNPVKHVVSLYNSLILFIDHTEEINPVKDFDLVSVLRQRLE